MLIDTARMVAAWLVHATHGVPAGLAGVPIDIGATRYDAVTVFDETNDEEAARLQAPDALPALVVNTAGTLDDATVAVQPYPGDLTVDVVLRHIVRDSDTDQALAALDQGQRAIRRTMARLFTVAGNEAARTRNNVQLYQLRAYRAELYRGNQDSILTMAHTYTIAVRDTWALS